MRTPSDADDGTFEPTHPRQRARIGRYELIGRLAVGGMAEVYLAVTGDLPRFRTLAVVKRVLPHFSLDKQFRRMFFDEARLGALLDHPNIARLIEVGRADGEYFLAIEAVQGQPLSAVWRRMVAAKRFLSAPQVAYIVAQAARGLGYAHRLTDVDGRLLNVVHRDVSPQNILVSFDGAVKLIDFGVAQALGRSAETRPNGLKGKIEYMSPEQVVGGQIDRRSDVFSLGIVLWELLCGRRLFSRATDGDSLNAIVNQPAPLPSTHVNIPPRLERIVMKALDKDPARRFDRAEDMAIALDRFALLSDDFEPGQVSQTMKGLFAAEFQRWRATVASALVSAGTSDEGDNDEQTLTRPYESGATTTGVTQALGPPALLRNTPLPQFSLQTPLPVLRPPPLDSSSALDLLEAFPAIRMFPGSPPSLTKTYRRLNALGATILALIGVGAASVLVHTSGARVSPPSTAPPIESTITTPWIAMIAPSHDRRSVETSSSPSIPEPSTSSPPSVLPQSVGQSFANAAVVVPRSIQAKPTSTPTSTFGHRGPSPAARAHRAQSRRALSSGRKKAIASRSEAPMVRVDSRSAEPTVQVANDCTIFFGTRPWSEVWLDGASTRKHTPYREPIACGHHRVTFKRSDLAIQETLEFDVESGETFKRAVTLAAVASDP